MTGRAFPSDNSDRYLNTGRGVFCRDAQIRIRRYSLDK